MKVGPYEVQGEIAIEVLGGRIASARLDRGPLPIGLAKRAP